MYSNTLSVIGIGPDGVRIDGHTTLRTWRNKTPKPTARQIHNALQRREEIATLVEKGLILITDLEEGLEESEQKIPQAMIQALLEHFGNTRVRDALQELRLA